jgi:signal transduction histidine kinase
MQLVEGMTTGVTRLKEIIENMLDMAKIDSRALQIQAQPVHIEHLVQKLVWQLQWALNERNLTLQSHGLADLPPVEGDADALYKALHHLVANAVKYTPNGGHITISAHLDQPTNGSAIEIAIRDTGIGIDPRFLELIFDKFYQTGDITQHSSGATKFKGGGPGLGLAIARGIAQAHGGSLHAESAGHDESRLPGSTFIMRLPTSHAHGASANAHSQRIIDDYSVTLHGSE